MRALCEKPDPWLLEVHFPQPHDPYTPFMEFLERYPLQDIELPSSYDEETFEGKPGLLAREAGLWAELGEEDFRQGLRHYYAYCEQLDHFVGVVLDALRDSGTGTDTLTVLSCDHGDLVGAHGMFIKGWMPYEETHRVPMVARWPGLIQPGGSTDCLVHLHDWAHTFISVGGAEPLPHADGKDLMPLLNDPEGAAPQMPAHIMNVYYGGEFLYTQRIAIGDRYKYVFNGFDRDEFYDLERDPGEVHNVLDEPEYAEAVRRTRDALWELMADFGDPYSGHRYGAGRYLPAHSRGPLRESWD
jgi:arylsulfatase A-like enzyme